MTRRDTTIAVSLLMVVALVAGGVLLAAGPVAAQETETATETDTDTDAESETNCQTVVVHDAYLNDDEAITALANGTDVRSTEENTQVTIGENNTFYRVRGQNPNAYCVHFVIKVDEEAMPPAQLPAAIQSNDGEHEASWDAVHDFDTGESYTQIEFTLPAKTEAAWSPNEMRITSIAWASESREKAGGMFERLQDRVQGPDDVEQKEYDITANASGEQVTVPLQNPETGESIDDWQARYTTNDGRTWHKLQKDAEAPVFYTESDDGTAIRLTFNDASARVKFIAEPNKIDEVDEQITLWKSGLKEIGDRMPWN